MNPTRCLSSYLTTEVLKLRNPQGTEENWILGGEHIDNYVIYYGKVITTELAVGVLCVAAAVETVAYTILVGISLPIWFVTDRPLKMIFPLFQSGGFTLLWNVGNATVFNPFCTNVFTHESFARFSMDHWTRGQVFKIAIKITVGIAFFVFQAFAISHGTYISSTDYPTFSFLDDPFLRTEDGLYIADWMRTHQIAQLISSLRQQVTHVHPIATFGQNINNSIDEGADFFKEFILQSGQIDTDARQKVLDADPDIYVFALTRAVYIYVFGAKRDEEVPDFFKSQTKPLIEKMRQDYAQDEGITLESAMQNLSTFEEEPADAHTKTILNDLKQAAHGELQAGLFVTRCWQKACEDTAEEASQIETVETV